MMVERHLRLGTSNVEITQNELSRGTNLESRTDHGNAAPASRSSSRSRSYHAKGIAIASRLRTSVVHIDNLPWPAASEAGRVCSSDQRGTPAPDSISQVGPLPLHQLVEVTPPSRAIMDTFPTLHILNKTRPCQSTTSSSAAE